MTDEPRETGLVTETDKPDFTTGIEAHDQRVDDSGAEIWIGAEPTFTLRSSEAPEWLSQALGGEKYNYALKIAKALFLKHPGSVMLRTVGRQYSREDKPRWSIGLYERRDGVPVWNGPPDPVLTTDKYLTNDVLHALVDTFKSECIRRQWRYKRITTQSNNDARFLIRMDGNSLDEMRNDDPRLYRPSIHEEKTPESGLSDSLSEEGCYLITLGAASFESTRRSVWVELPSFKRPADFIDCLDAMGAAAVNSGLTSLVIKGFQPPVDDSVSWTTITPDPAVIEINQAPEPTVARFYKASIEIFGIADQLGLSTYRIQYNGRVSDSGGGGQFTLGGRTPLSSPFFTKPNLLPRLVKYFNRHPSLTYWFAPDYVGSASQLPRADEGTRDAFYELGVALDQLERQDEITPEMLWASLAPFLADPSGNSHRSELNIEKLWNKNLPGRGCLGLMECRAFKMPRTPQRAVSIAMLLRAIAGMLIDRDVVSDLIDWGDELHDRFALPFFLQQDLRSVLRDLEQLGFALPIWVMDELLSDSTASRWSVDFNGFRLSIEQAIEFWPLVGDVASQEGGGSRLVDSSTLRLQISLIKIDPATPIDLNDWQVQFGGYSIPLVTAEDENGEVRLTGIRYRDFEPWRGLHPTIQPLGPVTLSLSHASLDDGIEISLHNWRVDGLGYAGLPTDLEDAAKRRDERLVVKKIRKDVLPSPSDPPTEAVTTYSCDLRRLNNY